jgi:hypothetical protein
MRHVCETLFFGMFDASIVYKISQYSRTRSPPPEENLFMFFAQLDNLPKEIPQDGNVIWYGVAAVVVVGIVLTILWKVLFAKKELPDLEKSQRENLGDYPPPPKKSEDATLYVKNSPVRVRLVVVAPMGKQQARIDPDQVAALLDEVLEGLGTFTWADKPRVKVWPPQLSKAGFAPTFHRLVQSPDPEKQPSRWVLVAGPARAGDRPILLGLALLADQNVKHGKIDVQETEWPSLLRIETE